MPTYDFRCPDGHEFEKFFRKISDAQPEVPCPVCGKPAERKVSGGAGLLFKGSGFYLTDYGKNAHRKAAPTSDSSTESGERKGSESKPDASGVKPEKAESKKAGETTPAAKPASKPKSES